MKKKILFVLILLVSLVGYVSCTKDNLGVEPQPVPPVVNPAKYTITALDAANGKISPSKIEVTSGSSASVVLNPAFGYKSASIIVNDVVVALTSNNYSLYNINTNYTLQPVFTKTLNGFATDGDWVRDSVYNKQKDGTWLGYDVKSNRDSLILLPSSNYEIYWAGKLVGNGKWSISETTNPATFNLGGSLWNIDRLDDKYLYLSSDNIPVLGDPEWKMSSSKLKYSHHKK